MSRPHPKRKRGLSSREKRELGTGLLFISPWIVGFSVFMAYPIVMSLYYSLCDFSVLQAPKFIGLENYRQLFQDDVFVRFALPNTVYYAARAIPLGIVLAIAIAMLLNTGVRGMAVYRTVYYLPSMVPAVALAILWLWIFNGQYGVLNYVLKQIPYPHLELSYGMGGAAKWVPTHVAVSLANIDPPNWLGDKTWVKPAFILAALWTLGNAMVIYLAGLQDVPSHLYEAADLDGANWWQKTRHVTLPMISPVILFNGIMAIIGTFNYFAVPYIMAPGGKPARAGYFLAVNLYDNAFSYLRMGYASAMAWILFIMVFALTMLAMKLSARHVHYGGG